MAKLTLTEARNLMLKGRPWTFRLEYQGSTFWLATGRSRTEPVEVHYGVIGGKSTIMVKNWDYIEKVAPAKEVQGYVYTDTAFVRVQPATILGATPPQATPPSTRPIPVAPVTPSVLVKSSLPGPWGSIVSVQRQADGTWWGVDNNGKRVVQTTKDGARSLVASHQHIKVAGL